jgi:hypothetical protein
MNTPATKGRLTRIAPKTKEERIKVVSAKIPEKQIKFSPADVSFLKAVDELSRINMKTRK